MSQPDRAEWVVGRTRFNQTVKLIRERCEGRMDWRIVKEAVNQRDETETIWSLDAALILRMADIVREARE